jgi:hypothetical protein
MARIKWASTIKKKDEEQLESGERRPLKKPWDCGGCEGMRFTLRFVDRQLYRICQTCGEERMI